MPSIDGNRNWLKCLPWKGERWPGQFAVLSFSYILFFFEIPVVRNHNKLSVYCGYYYDDRSDQESIAIKKTFNVISSYS